MNVSRRAFLAGGSAAVFVSGCRTLEWFGAPNLTFGVVSDIHVTTPDSVALFEASLRYFKRRGVDAVMVPGDLTDWGLKSSLRYVKEAWDRVFGGTEVVPLFCTGNHDYGGWGYGDMTMEMHANGYSEEDSMADRRDGCKNSRAGVARAWEEIFGESFADVRLRTVKGYDFVSCEYDGSAGLADWMRAHRGRLSGAKPFFFFQHLPVKGTTSDSFGWADNGVTKPILDSFSNCISFNGHTHRPFTDERLIWQGRFTQISIPSLSYASAPPGHENGNGPRNGTSCQAMPKIPTRRDLRGGQGFVVSVFDEKMVVERLDLEESGVEGAPAWIVPLKDRASLWSLPAWMAGAKPYDTRRRAAASVAPQFPEGASLTLRTRNTENRTGKWVIVLDCRFPSAVAPKGERVFDYEVKAVPVDGSPALEKKFLSPAYACLPKYEPAEQRFWFDVAELPQDVDYRIEVRALNCFGKASRPLVSPIRRGKPGLGEVTPLK